MSGESYLLCALVPPGSIEAEVGRVQASMFADHGLSSAEALPPLIPIAFFDLLRRGERLLSRLNDCAPSGWKMGLRDTEWVDGHLYLSVESGGTWPALRAAALADGGMTASVLFPVAEGFYLGCADAPPEDRERIRPRVQTRWFTSGTLALMTLETSNPGPGWWRELHWEVTEEQPLRGRRER